MTGVSPISPYISFLIPTKSHLISYYLANSTQPHNISGQFYLIPTHTNMKVNITTQKYICLWNKVVPYTCNMFQNIFMSFDKYLFLEVINILI